MGEEIKDFEDAYKPKSLFENSKQIEFADILDKQLIVKDFRELPSEYNGTFIVVQAELDGELVTFATGSSILRKQIKSIKLPVKAKIIKPENKRYYTFASWRKK